MEKILHVLSLIIQYITKYGFYGVIFLYKLKFKRNKPISFYHPKYNYPIILRNNSTDINIFYQMLFYQDYNINYDFVPKVIIDGGANIGLAAIFF